MNEEIDIRDAETTAHILNRIGLMNPLVQHPSKPGLFSAGEGADFVQDADGSWRANVADDYVGCYATLTEAVEAAAIYLLKTFMATGRENERAADAEMRRRLRAGAPEEVNASASASASANT